MEMATVVAVFVSGAFPHTCSNHTTQIHIVCMVAAAIAVFVAYLILSIAGGQYLPSVFTNVSSFESHLILAHTYTHITSNPWAQR